MQHHFIDYRPPAAGAAPRTMVLVVTSSRVVFGGFDPPRVKFEVPKDRLARVELAPKKTKIILWTWTELPRALRVGSALPNVVMERHVYGCNPLQLRAAFEHLRALSYQQDREQETGGLSDLQPPRSAAPPQRG